MITRTQIMIIATIAAWLTVSTDTARACDRDHTKTHGTGVTVAANTTPAQTEVHNPHIVTAGLQITGMHCQMCSSKIEKAVRALPGVATCSVSFETGRGTVHYDRTATTPTQILEAIKTTGFTATIN